MSQNCHKLHQTLTQQIYYSFLTASSETSKYKVGLNSSFFLKLPIFQIDVLFNSVKFNSIILNTSLYQLYCDLIKLKTYQTSTGCSCSKTSQLKENLFWLLWKYLTFPILYYPTSSFWHCHSPFKLYQNFTKHTSLT